MIVILLIGLYSLLWTSTVHSYSACDEVDITFIIDAESIISYHREIIQFMKMIANHGSAEYTGYSVFVYGALPKALGRIELLTLKETQSMPTRSKLAYDIEYRLRRPFRTIRNGGSPGRTSHVDVVTAFRHALRQRRPFHAGGRKKKLGYEPDDKSIGNHDGRHIYIVFDYNNRIIRDSRFGDMCALFDRLDRHRIYHRDQKIHFMLGQNYDPRITTQISCHRRRPRYIKYNSFQQFSPQLLYPAPMERIYDITCPAVIRSKTYDGYINVGNHVQYIDPHSIIRCTLYYWDHDHNVATPDQLDTRKSFIKVKDYANDDNTWQLYDYLVADPTTFEHIQKLGCRNPVYKIIGMGHGVQQQAQQRDEVEAVVYRIVTLYVRLPATPMEYISTANIKGNVPIHTHTHHGHHHRHKRHGHHRRRKDRSMSLFHRKRHYSREYRDFDDHGRKHAPPPPGAKVIQNDNIMVYNEDEQMMAGEHLTHSEQKETKEAVHHVVRKVEREIDDVAKHTDEWRKKAQAIAVPKAVIDLSAKHEWEYIFTSKQHRTLGPPRPKGFKAIMNKQSGGALQIEYGFWYKLHVGVYFKFYWKILFNKIQIHYKIYGDWTINYHFDPKFVGEFSLTLDNILNDGKSKVFYIETIPILMRAYTQIFAEIVTLPQQVHVEIRCQYKERIEVGFMYSNQWNKGQSQGLLTPIKKRTLISKGCTKELGILDKKRRFVTTCPVDQFRGFDLKFSVKIGGSFYLIMNSYMRMEFVIPLRVNYPEMNPAVCQLPPNADMCAVSPFLKASFTMSMKLFVYNGSWVDENKIMHFVRQARFMDRFTGEPMSMIKEQYFQGPLQIIPERFMGCLELKGKLKRTNDNLFPTCCPHLHGLYHGHMMPIRGQYIISANPMQAILQSQGNSPFVPNPYYRAPPPNEHMMARNYGKQQRRAYQDVMNRQKTPFMGMYRQAMQAPPRAPPMTELPMQAASHTPPGLPMQAPPHTPPMTGLPMHTQGVAPLPMRRAAMDIQWLNGQPMTGPVTVRLPMTRPAMGRPQMPASLMSRTPMMHRMRRRLIHRKGMRGTRMRRAPMYASR
eukprot:479345_1